MAELTNLEDAQRLARILQEVGPEHENYAQGMKMLRDFRDQQNQTLPVAQGEFRPTPVGVDTPDTDDRPVPEPSTIGSRAVDAAKIGLDMAGVMATGALAEIASGYAGALALGFGASAEDAATFVEAVQESLTMTPFSKAGRDALQVAAKPLMDFDSYITEASEIISHGSPAVSTAMKTILLGGTEVVGGKGTFDASNVRQAARQINARRAQVEKTASEMGIRLRESDMRSDVVAAANELSPDVRAAGAAQIRDSLQIAAQAQRDYIARRRQSAAQHHTVVLNSEVGDFARSLRQQYANDGIDLSKHPDVRKRIDQLEEMGELTGADAVTLVDNKLIKGHDLRQFAQIHRFVEREVDALPPGSKTLRATALRKLDNQMNEFLESQLQRDLIRGDPDGISIWRDAQTARNRYQKVFNADRTIKQLIEREATPEQAARYIIGASAVNMKPQAAATVKRLKQVFGNDSSEIQGIRDDITFEIVQPLLQDSPNFDLFLRNYDRMVRNNPSIMDELNIDQGALRDLRDFARTAAELPANRREQLAQNVQSALPPILSRVVFGNQLARATLRVNLARGVISSLFGTDRLSQRKIIGDITEGKFGEPMATSASQAYTGVAIGTAIASLPSAQTEAEKENEAKAARLSAFESLRRIRN